MNRIEPHKSWCWLCGCFEWRGPDNEPITSHFQTGEGAEGRKVYGQGNT